MKLAILLPGLLDSPDYTNMEVFSKRFKENGFETIVIDPAGLWRKTRSLET